MWVALTCLGWASATHGLPRRLYLPGFSQSCHCPRAREMMGDGIRPNGEGQGDDPGTWAKARVSSFLCRMGLSQAVIGPTCQGTVGSGSTGLLTRPLATPYHPQTLLCPQTQIPNIYGYHSSNFQG